MDSGNYVWDVLDYITLTWWNCDYNTVNNYSGHLENVYDNFQIKMDIKVGGGGYYKWIR